MKEQLPEVGHEVQDELQSPVSVPLEQKVEYVLQRKLKEKRFSTPCISHFKGVHQGEDIYVVGSGSSLNYINRSFFDKKIVVGVNSMFKFVPCTYVVMMHEDVAQECIDSGNVLVISKYKNGLQRELSEFKGRYFYFNHKMNTSFATDLSMLDSEDSLIIGGSTILPAIHFAYFLGAKNIILCGHDCGYINSKNNIDGYYTQEVEDRVKLRMPEFHKYTQLQTINLVNALRRKGINVCSLNPFINFNLEGNVFSNGIEDNM